MELIFSLLLFTLLLVGTSSVRVNQEVDRLKHSSLHLPLYHVRGRGPDSLHTSDSALSFSDVLALDDAHVEFLNSRLNKKNLTAVLPTNGLIEGNSLTAPLNPGESLGIGNYYTKIGLGTPPTYYPVVWTPAAPFHGFSASPVLSTAIHKQILSSILQLHTHTISCKTNDCSSLKDATLTSPMCTSSDKCVYAATYADQSFSQGYLSKDTHLWLGDAPKFCVRMRSGQQRPLREISRARWARKELSLHAVTIVN